MKLSSCTTALVCIITLLYTPHLTAMEHHPLHPPIDWSISSVLTANGILMGGVRTIAFKIGDIVEQCHDKIRGIKPVPSVQPVAAPPLTLIIPMSPAARPLTTRPVMRSTQESESSSAKAIPLTASILAAARLSSERSEENDEHDAINPEEKEVTNPPIKSLAATVAIRPQDLKEKDEKEILPLTRGKSIRSLITPNKTTSTVHSFLPNNAEKKPAKDEHKNENAKTMTYVSRPKDMVLLVI